MSRELNVSSLLVAPLAAASCTRNHARQSSVLRVRVAGSGTVTAKEPCQVEVIFIAFVWDREGERRKRVVSSERKL